ncbi:MAG: hypothetical protein QM564_08795 [Bergeyella sp.]
MEATAPKIDKLEIAKWLINLEDKETLEEVALLMKQHTKPKYDPIHEATLSDEEKVKYWREVGYTTEDSRQRALNRIAKWAEKKR